MRVVLLTDSLGCPREELNVKDVWTERILSDNELKKITFYTQCFYGLSSKMINQTYIRYLNPDVIICQIGIVDACRRALTKKEVSFISNIPYFRKIIHDFCSKNHYFLTKIRDIHDANCLEFGSVIKNLSLICNKCILLIEIAPPGEFLINKTFNVEDDIRTYNNIIYSMHNGENIRVTKPYNEYGIDLYNDYLIKNDGHHLNMLGQELVYNKVKSFLLSL